MPQKNELSQKRKLLVDGNELPGLIECSGPKDEDSMLKVPRFGRVVSIKSGVKEFEPITAKYAIKRGTNTKAVLMSWKFNDELHDVVLINCDAAGAEIDRWLLQDCELPHVEESKYDAGNVEYMSLNVTITTTAEPKYLPQS